MAGVLKKIPVKLMDVLDATGFVSEYKNHDTEIIYTTDFYIAMHKRIEAGMTYVQAYQDLGFPVKLLGADRANACGKRAEQMAREGKLNTVDPASYKGSVPLEKMGNLTDAEKLAFLTARTHYLETMAEVKKKFMSEYAEKISSSNKTMK